MELLHALLQLAFSLLINFEKLLLQLRPVLEKRCDHRECVRVEPRRDSDRIRRVPFKVQSFQNLSDIIERTKANLWHMLVIRRNRG